MVYEELLFVWLHPTQALRGPIYNLLGLKNKNNKLERSQLYLLLSEKDQECVQRMTVSNAL